MNNTSGWRPLDVRVMVKPDAVSDKIGGIFIPDQVKEQDRFAQTKATLVAVGANAWCEAKAGKGFVAPEPGARVLIAKYGGILFKGDDGDDYRIMNDLDVTAVMEIV